MIDKLCVLAERLEASADAWVSDILNREHTALPRTSEEWHRWGVSNGFLAAAKLVREAIEGRSVRESIVVAAIRVEGEVWTLPRPARHCHLVKAWRDAKQERIDDHEQGFVTSLGRFVGREEARKIADAAGQTSERDRGMSILFSEDLW